MYIYNIYICLNICIYVVYVYNLCLSGVDAEQHRITRATMKQKVEEGDESEIANMTERATKSIICCYSNLYFGHYNVVYKRE